MNERRLRVCARDCVFVWWTENRGVQSALLSKIPFLAVP